ncbi:MAG: hypothetical protein J6A88_09790 [Oscillospiraceae bacterium]|nr:hypothetical protein [Oscillospiraceae bacterium]MBO5324364.1 hypothetical protein [Oscillospiraceae bacterium]
MKKTRIIGTLCVAAVWLALTLGAWLDPAEEISVSERRKLAQLPSVSVKTVLDGRFMKDFESYTLDQFPLRDAFRQLKALVHYDLFGQKDNNGIYLADGSAAKLEYPLNEDSISHAVKKFDAIYRKYLEGTGSSVAVTVVPDKGYYLAEANGYPAMDYEKLFALVREGTSWAQFVDITDLLSTESYYATDTHWRQEQIVNVAQRLCEALGTTVPKAENYTAEEVEQPFYGVYSGQAAIPMDADIMYLLRSPILDGCTVYNHETGKTTPIYDLEKLGGWDLYEVYLSGAAALLTIENPQGDPDRELIVFRDSFGSSIVPLLLDGYSTVTVVDIRYLSSELLGNFVDFHGQDVLFLYSTLVLNSSSTIK